MESPILNLLSCRPHAKGMKGTQLPLKRYGCGSRSGESPLGTGEISKKSQFKATGKPWDDQIESGLNLRIAKLVKANPLTALHPSKRGSFDCLVDGLVVRMKELSE